VMFCVYLVLLGDIGCIRNFVGDHHGGLIAAELVGDSDPAVRFFAAERSRVWRLRDVINLRFQKPLRRITHFQAERHDSEILAFPVIRADVDAIRYGIVEADPVQ